MIALARAWLDAHVPIPLAVMFTDARLGMDVSFISHTMAQEVFRSCAMAKCGNRRFQALTSTLYPE
jgi:hypothetical protein